MNNEINYVSPFKKFCITVGNLPTAYIESMSYYEGLTYLVNYLSNNVIPALNNNGKVVEELQEQFTILKNYVDNYFDNLDVQEEINNKLDEMAESGELTDIIAQYLGLAGILVYNTLSDMKTAENISNGSTCKTLGYYSLNDGGGALYKVRTITNEDIVNDMDIVALNNVSLVGEILNDEILYVDQFGAKGNNTNDDSNIINYAINYCINKKIKLGLLNKNYKVNNEIIINNGAGYAGLIIEGNNATLITNNLDDTEYVLKLKTDYTEAYGQTNIIIRDLIVDANFKTNCILVDNTNQWSLENVQMKHGFKGLTLINTYYGNVNSNSNWDTCFYGITFEKSDDVNAPTYQEVNTIEFSGDSYIGFYNANRSNFDTTLTTTYAIKIDVPLNAVKFTGIVAEHYDVMIKGADVDSPGSASTVGNITFEKCYFEGIYSDNFMEWLRNSTTPANYLNSIITITNCRIYPTSTKKLYCNCGTFYIRNNDPFKIEIASSPTALAIDCDIDTYLIDMLNVSDATTINLNIEKNKPRQSNYMLDPNNWTSTDTYINNYNRNIQVQETNSKYYPLYLNGATRIFKNQKALAINSVNLSFLKQGLNPVGLIIDGEDNNKYMLSTEDGTSIKLIKMNNPSRIYQRINTRNALWLYNHIEEFEIGTRFFCEDLNATVELNLVNDKRFWKTTGNKACIAIGTSKELYQYLSSQPQNKYWCPCWDISFNHGVYSNVSEYDSGYDWAMNNDPLTTNTAIKCYGTIANRPASPNYDKCVYYATDEDKYYVWNLATTTWNEVTPIVA